VINSDYSTVKNNNIGDVISYDGTICKGIDVNNSDYVTLSNNYIYNVHHMDEATCSGIHIQSTSGSALVSNNYLIDNGNLIDRGNCESGGGASPEDGNSPMIFGESNPLDSNCDWTRDNTITSYEGSYHYKLNKTSVAAGGTASIGFTETASGGGDLHGMVPGIEYTFEAYIYLVTGSSPLAAEAYLGMDDDTAVARTQAAANTFDEWQKVSLTFTVGAAATEAWIFINIDSAAAQNEYIYVDNIRLYQTGIGNEHETNYDDDGTDTHLA
jgi:hypothetical protein